MAQELGRRLRLIVITDRAAAAPRSVVEVVRAALAAGAPAIQLRDKSASARELYEAGQALLPDVRTAGALFFVNDRFDVALALGADGVHVGPDDLPVATLRDASPDGFLIGTSTDDPNEARSLVEDGASYIGCGTVYPTATKVDAGAVLGVDGLDRVARAVTVPVIGIGGITPERSAEVARTAASGIAVIASVMAAADVRRAVTALMEPWDRRA
jgi:thiamine-phosphate diphosphorylase